MASPWKSSSSNEKAEEKINALIGENQNPIKTWSLAQKEFSPLQISNVDQLGIFQRIYETWNIDQDGPKIAWIPTEKDKTKTNLAKKMKEKGFSTFTEFYRWSRSERDLFWKDFLETSKIPFKNKPSSVFHQAKSICRDYLPDAKLNIAEACFLAPKDDVAIIYQADKDSEIIRLTFKELDELSNQVANGLISLGFQAGDAIAIDMVMNLEAVAIYLGIVKAGMTVVSIADSFAPQEITLRLKIANAKAIFTQDQIYRNGKAFPLYPKIKEANAPLAIVLGEADKIEIALRDQDLHWNAFLSSDKSFTPVTVDGDHAANILFSSGTTGDPKAIPWTHTTPMKCAMDGYYHHDIQPGDVVAWPTNLGWMMGPWLIFASLINRASIALYGQPPLGEDFGEFVQNAKVTMLGLVPSIVKVWRSTGCMEKFDWSEIKCFSSTGECSNSSDYLYLMSLANYRPVIEYCGGTEIGGGYMTGTLLQPASPATFTTPALGLDFQILDETKKPTDEGEVFLIPPSIGLSTRLLNRNHDEVYYHEMPEGPNGHLLRRHGDQIRRLPSGFFQAQGRADDTMNLGGIKVSSAEIERTINQHAAITESAAIATQPKGGGPSELVLFLVMNSSSQDLELLKTELQHQIKTKLNPLFKIKEVIKIDQLPRTASNKVMRRVLRDRYQKI